MVGIGTTYKTNFGSYDIIVGFEQKGNKKKMITKRFGEHILKKTPLNLERMSASDALERIMDICGIDQDDKFTIRNQFNKFAKPTKRYFNERKKN